jgi:hypothetical protein
MKRRKKLGNKRQGKENKIGPRKEKGNKKNQIKSNKKQKKKEKRKKRKE